MPPHPNPRKKYKSSLSNSNKLKFSVHKSLNGSEMSDKKVKKNFFFVYLLLQEMN